MTLKALEFLLFIAFRSFWPRFVSCILSESAGEIEERKRKDSTGKGRTNGTHEEWGKRGCIKGMGNYNLVKNIREEQIWFVKS